jgi:hypothetical protein
MATLIYGNCLSNPNVIEVGQVVYVPSLPAPGIVPGTPAVTFTAPSANGIVPVAALAPVTGESSWTQPGTVLVRALDNMGKVLDEKRATALAPALNGTWQWQVQLNLAGAVTGAQLGRHRSIIMMATVVFAAIATPSTDPFSMLMLAVPMMVLFLVAEVITRAVDRRRAARALAQVRIGD